MYGNSFLNRQDGFAFIEGYFKDGNMTEKKARIIQNADFCFTTLISPHANYILK